MKKYVFPVIAIGLGALLILTTPATVKALVAAPPPIYQRIANADVVIVGKIVRFADKSVKAKQYPTSREPTEYQIAIVKIEDPILNQRGLTEIRVGVLPPPPPPPPPKPGVPRLPRRPRDWGRFKPQVGEKHLLYLQEHHKEPFYLVQAYYDHANLAKVTPALKKQIEESKAYAKLLQKPMEGLQSKSAEVRFQTAALLLARYRSYRQGARKEVAVDAKESKLILQGLLDGDWTAKPVYNKLTAAGAFGLLGAKPQDGWMQPRDFRQYGPAAQKWLRDNVGTFRVKRFVAADAK